jgi:hypothetical protein
LVWEHKKFIGTFNRLWSLVFTSSAVREGALSGCKMHWPHDTFGFLHEYTSVKIPNQNFGKLVDCFEGTNS